MRFYFAVLINQKDNSSLTSFLNKRDFPRLFLLIDNNTNQLCLEHY
ncbi:hypothetical protein VCSRO155_0952 [Vibrio cholerae]|nr:hypothetical protein VCHE09_1931 [Vibrio paracholerae HE-09]SYZ83029.1 Uncharacterised protein [Vibrio paracholerae]GHW29864.1 hypothetical protein VCSRO193_2952 [Vibrio cholerae]GHW92393.1 hypothetical protein VCSRO155_0952 [Vibrio cholerae]GHX35294.1 hypothetical protein VCSRO108_1239 [Vibrio cholerae]